MLPAPSAALTTLTLATCATDPNALMLAMALSTPDRLAWATAEAAVPNAARMEVWVNAPVVTTDLATAKAEAEMAEPAALDLTPYFTAKAMVAQAEPSTAAAACADVVVSPTPKCSSSSSSVSTRRLQRRGVSAPLTPKRRLSARRSLAGLLNPPPHASARLHPTPLATKSLGLQTALALFSLPLK